MTSKRRDIEDETLSIAVEMAERKREADAAHQAELFRKATTLDVATQLGVAAHLNDARREVERRREQEENDRLARQENLKVAGIIGGAILAFVALVWAIPSGTFWYFIFCGVAGFYAASKRLSPERWFFSSVFGLAILSFIKTPDTWLKRRSLNETGLGLSIFTLAILSFISLL